MFLGIRGNLISRFSTDAKFVNQKLAPRMTLTNRLNPVDNNQIYLSIGCVMDRFVTAGCRAAIAMTPPETTARISQLDEEAVGYCHTVVRDL